MPRSPERILQELESEGFDTSAVGSRTEQERTERRLEREAREGGFSSELEETRGELAERGLDAPLEGNQIGLAGEMQDVNEQTTFDLRDPVEVEFIARGAANEIRDRPDVAKHLDETDDRRTRTIRLDDDAPEAVVDRVTIEAADGTKEEAEKFGQEPLTPAEKTRIDFTQVNTLRARSIKGIAVGLGVDDWTAFVDPTLTVDEHREVLERAAREDRGGQFEGERGEAEISAFLGNAFETVETEEHERAVEAAFGGDVGAGEFVRESAGEGATIGEIFDIDVRPTDPDRPTAGVEVVGADADRLLDIHEDRSSRAQAIDERRRSQNVTLDPLAWAANPGRLDYPGVDTIQPDRVHARRSERARSIDEREIARVAPDAETWVSEPDRFDWPGVDRPETFGPTMDTPIPVEERGERGREGILSSLAESLFDEGMRFGADVDTPDEFDAPPGFGGGSVEIVDPEGEAFLRELEAEEMGGMGPEAFLDVVGEGDVAEELADEFLDTSGLGSQMGLGGDVVETESQATFGFVEADEGESRLDVEAASTFGVDDRSTARRGAEKEREETLEAGLEAFGMGERRNVRLDEL